MNSERNIKNTILKNRVYFILSFFLITSLIVIGRLYYIQIIKGEIYFNKANNQYVKPDPNFFDRGSIYFVDKDGHRISASTIKAGYKIAINPKAIEYPEDVYNNLAFYIDLDEDFYISRAEKENDPYEEIAKRVSYENGEKIKKLDLKGVTLIKENWRFYPGSNLASQTIGFVGLSSEDNDIKGKYGLEKFYNSFLATKQTKVFRNFFAEFFYAGDNDLGQETKASLVTTIEPKVQSFVEQELENISKKWNSKKIGAIVMDPKTGAIISMGVYPNFDLNYFSKVDDISIYSNPLVEDVYEMGSIIKPITMAIGLDTGAVNPETTYDDKGSITLNEKTFSNYDKRARGVVNMQAVLNQSLNTGVYFVVSKVGNAVFSDYMKKFFSNKTGIDLPNESSAMLSNLDSNLDIEFATASFGQGIAMSPISTVVALSSLANGGKLVKPYIVEEIEYDTGITEKIEKSQPIQIFKPETSEEISRMLVKVVDEALRGGAFSLKNYSIAAKTGTAQMSSSKGGYDQEKYLHSFFGYFPAYDPKFIVFLYHTEPQNVEYASETLTEPFMNIAKFLLNYYNVAPDRNYENNI